MDDEVQRQDGLAVMGGFLGLLALIGVIVSIGISVRALDDDGTAATAPAASAADMDAVMAERTKAFPAKTKGVGGQDLAPIIQPDGTKEFRLTASEFDWEVEPGKVVKAMGYNQQVPGPTICV